MSSFWPKTPSMKKILTSFLSQKVSYETLVNYTKPWTLYLVSVLRNRGKTLKICVFSKLLFEENHEADFFLEFFSTKMYPRIVRNFLLVQKCLVSLFSSEKNQLQIRKKWVIFQDSSSSLYLPRKTRAKKNATSFLALNVAY